MRSLPGIVLLLYATAAWTQVDGRRSGFDFMSPATQAMQLDDTLNPGMLWVQQGSVLWNRSEGPANKSCASCHGDAATSMRGVAARYPALERKKQLPINLSQRINQCRQEQQQTSPWRAEQQELLSLESFISRESKGLPITPPHDKGLQPHVAQGRALYVQRMGQLNLSCAQCHDERAGQRLGGNLIPQAHPMGYPVYRLEWQTIGSLQRRLRNCMNGVRAEPFAFGSLEMVQLELYLSERARGMAVEAPGVRP